MASFRTVSALTALFVAVLTLQSSTSALLFQVDNLDCNELDYSVSITPTEWQRASYLELFFISTQGGQNYSTLLSCNPSGDFPDFGNYNKALTFGSIQPTGDFQIGVGLANANGQIMYTSTNVPMTVVDTRTFHFGGCGNTGVESALTSSFPAAASAATTTSSRFASSIAAAPTTTGSAVQVSSSSSASATPAAGTISSSSSAAIQPTHKGVNAGAIAGGVIGGLLLLLIAGLGARWYSSRRRIKALGGAVHRMDSIRSSSPEEKGFAAPGNDGTLSSEAQYGRLSEGYHSRREVDGAGYGAPSLGSPFEVEAFPIPTYPHSEAHSYHNAYQVPPVPGSDAGGDIRVVHMPFSLDAGRRSESRSRASLAEDPFAESALPYLPSPTGARSRESFFDAPVAGSEHSIATRGRVPPPVLDTSISQSVARATPAATLSKSGSASTAGHDRKPSSFKIPRVNVPAYPGTQQPEASTDAVEPVSRASSTRRRRRSAGAATFVSVEEENPFVDAQSMRELPPLDSEARKAEDEGEGDLTPMQEEVAAALQYAEGLSGQDEQQARHVATS